MLKMGMAGAFFSIFLNSRFDKSDIEPEKKNIDYKFFYMLCIFTIQYCAEQ